MLGLPLAFTAPAVLFGLVLLPVIWWLLRLTPPRPQTEIFPPLRILARVMKKEETPSKSPWWLTLLRLVLAALIILALANPVLNPRQGSVSAAGPLVLVVDNGWATAPDWQARVDTAAALIDDAETAAVPVALVLTAERAHQPTPTSASTARERLRAAAPRPIRPDRATAVEAITTALGDTAPGTLAFLSDGLASADSDTALRRLGDTGPAEIMLIEGSGAAALALTAARNAADRFTIEALRLPDEGPRTLTLTAYDVRGRPIAAGSLQFDAGAASGAGSIAAPFELRNDFARIGIGGTATAGAAYLLDDSFRRRRVALLSGEPLDLSQPLLSPLYYIERALQPFADLVEPREDELVEAIPALIEERPSVIVMADIGTLPEASYEPLQRWIENGGTLLRFAGPRLAGAAADDPLVPVNLRQGERALGGSLSWSEPQPLAGFATDSPFAGIDRPEDVTVNRQVLAEPSPDLAERTWASLADGTPLVTTREIGAGRIVLFHVTASATWSNLPLSGAFVEMLQRTIQLSRAGGVADGPAASEAQSLPPYRMLSAEGTLVQPSGAVQPLVVSSETAPRASFENPPGLYGTEEGFRALNLMGPEDSLAALTMPETAAPVIRAGLIKEEAKPLKPWLLTAALALLIIDSLIVLAMTGGLPAASALSRRPAGRRPGAGAATVLAIGLGLSPLGADQGQAADQRPGDDLYLDRLDRTHLAYVVTGDGTLDEISRQGLEGLTEFLAVRTSLEAGAPVGLDIEADELSFFPIIYWPISADAALPSDTAISRLDAYMKNGGTVLFDTRDELSGLAAASSASMQTQKLRAILSDLDIPPLEPVPPEHVLTKAFYLLNEFPGRYRGSRLWVEALPQTEAEADRPAQAGDGVSSIIITGNDLASAWAVDANGVPIYPTVPPDPLQREYAFRVGVNIMMYMLTGNYKADQVHVPALLERLGQ